MPSVSLAELQQYTWDLLDNNQELYVADQLTKALNESYRIINVFAGINISTVAVSGGSVQNAYLYNTPSPILIPMEAYFAQRQLRRLSLGDLARNYRSFATDTTARNGPVGRWAPVGINQFVLHPADSIGSREIQITGVVEPTLLAAGNGGVVGSGTAGVVTSSSLGLSYSPTAGNTLIIGIATLNYTSTPPAITSVIGNSGSSFVQDSNVVISATGQYARLCFYRYSNVPPDISLININVDNTADILAASLVECFGSVSVDVLDTTGNGAVSTSLTTGSFATANATDTVLGFFLHASSAASSASLPWVQFAAAVDSGAGYGCAFSYQDTAVTNTYQPAASTAPQNNYWWGLGASYKFGQSILSLEDEYVEAIILLATHRCQLAVGGKVFAESSNLMLNKAYAILKDRIKFQGFKFPQYRILTYPSQ